MVKLSKKCRAVIHTSMGEMTLDLLVDKAPRTVENFVKLAHKGFYDGTTFHRVLKDFMVQGGCPKGDGTGGPGYTIPPEFNDTPHILGTVSMARSNDPHSGGSQFFIVHGEARYLDSKYSAFGQLSVGEEVLDKIAQVPVFENRWKELSQPRDAIYINRIELEGVEFDGDEGRQAEPEAPAAQTQEQEQEPVAESVAEDEGDAPDEAAEKAPARSRRKAAPASRSRSSDGKSETKSSAKSSAKPAAKSAAKSTTKSKSTAKPAAKSAAKSSSKASPKAAKKKSSSRSRDS